MPTEPAKEIIDVSTDIKTFREGLEILKLFLVERNSAGRGASLSRASSSEAREHPSF
ncbi:Hypothetical predicted protein [Olea europaea subsp. europaea]|uniref:Uncharacterized protein n=1 Tax=Olea europaea subsp. europaea TaxID=158383 RepID=A0A8S0R806_OLEEU|nr:Hypothetical predicted protein [Olea europaea subsp. europaea]